MQFLSACNLPKYLKVQTYLSKNSHKQVAQANCSKAIYKPQQRRLGFGGVKPGLRNSYSNQTLSVQHITVHLCSRLSHPKKVSD